MFCYILNIFMVILICWYILWNWCLCDSGSF